MKSALIMLCATAFLAGPANAEPVFVTAETYPTERVSFADLNLSSPAGLDTLKQRIRGAAKRVCKAAEGRSFESYLVTHGCLESAYEDGREQMRNVIAGHSQGTAVAAASLTIRGQ